MCFIYSITIYLWFIRFIRAQQEEASRVFHKHSGFVVSRPLLGHFLLRTMHASAPRQLEGDELDVFFSQEKITILGFGSLLSEQSSRRSFPDLENFREVRVKGYRRTFQHPAFIFFERGIAEKSSSECSSLSAHRLENDQARLGFVCVAFEVKPMWKSEWLKREEEFEFHLVPFWEQQMQGTDFDGIPPTGTGIMCCSSCNDDVFIQRWGEEKYIEKLSLYQLRGIWGLELNREIKPCSVYLRHCVLAAQKRSTVCLESFLDETFLVDMKTTIREYLSLNPWVMDLAPPESLAGRYSG